MNVQSYTFKSPYPSSMQTGTAVPQPEEQKPLEVPKTEEVKGETEQKVESYVSSLGNSNSINVANSSTDSALSSSLSEFTQINTQVQAEQAYSS